MSIDSRLIERRKTVAEDKAKRNVSRLLKFLAMVVVVGAGVWLVFSPWLSVSMVTTTGVEASDSHATLVDQRVVAGTPMVLISISRVETALLEDPWVARASVRLRWPDVVDVEVVERVPTAWVRTEDGWTRRATDGVALPSEPEPDEAMARIEMPEVADSGVVESTDLLGALEFIEELPADLHQGTVVSRHEDELWATVAGYQVRLGRAVDMGEKARSLNALLAKDIPQGSTLVVIAPTNPAVMTPEKDADGTAEIAETDAGEATDGEDGGAEDTNDNP